MSQIFHRSANTIARVSIFGAVFFVAGLLGLFAEVNRSPWVTEARVAREQPIQFSHERHVAGNGIDCRYCHTSVEESSFAGIPPTKTCMNCHSQIFSASPYLEPVRESFRSDRPIQWTRVHDLPDFVYFDHSIHVNKGVGCTTCHGQVDRMPLMWQEQSLQMEWCLDCHRNPERYVRPREAVFRVDYAPPANQLELGRGWSRNTTFRSSRAARRAIDERRTHEQLPASSFKPNDERLKRARITAPGFMLRASNNELVRKDRALIFKTRSPKPEARSLRCGARSTSSRTIPPSASGCPTSFRPRLKRSPTRSRGARSSS